jgi:hypothetical protein
MMSTLYMPNRPSQTPAVTPVPPRPATPLPPSMQRTLLAPQGLAPQALQQAPLPQYVTPLPDPPRVTTSGPVIAHSTRSPVLAFVLVAITVLVVAGAVGVAWRVWSTYTSAPASHP